MGQTCSLCNNKASIWTRTKLKDGFLCKRCASQCSEHIIDTIAQFTAEDIRAHLVYRRENFNSKRFRLFSPDKMLGQYEVIFIDTVNRLWSLKTDKPFHKSDNPDIFTFEQILKVHYVIKKECINKFQKFNGKNSRVPKRLRRKVNRVPLYGYWFYVIIDVQHTMFRQLQMRINKYIVTDKNKDAYQNCMTSVEDIITELQTLILKERNSDE